MKLFVCTDHDGHYPVGVASVIVAVSECSAREILDCELRRHCLATSDVSPYTLAEIPLDRQQVLVLNDGNY